MQQALDNLSTWASRWGMEFNVPKCKVMHLGHNNPHNEYLMDGQRLETTEEEKDIGVTVTGTLKPSAQCARASKTAQSVLSQISRAFHYRDRHVFMRLCSPTLRILHPSVVTLDGRGQRVPGKGPKAGCENGLGSQGEGV